MFFRMGPDRRRIREYFAERGRFSGGELPDQHRRRDRRAAACNTGRPTHLRFQPPTLECRNIRHVLRDEDTSMVRCFPPLLTLAVMLWGLVPAAWATGPLGPEIRFFSRSGQDPVDDLAYFRGHLGILRPTFTDNRLYAAYRIMLGGRFSEAQARQLLARCCGAPETPPDAMTSWPDLRKRVAGVAPAQETTAFRRRPEDMQSLRRLVLSECLSQFRRDAARAHRRTRRQQSAGARLGDRPGRRPPQLQHGFSPTGRTAECAALAQGRPRLSDRRGLFLSPGLYPRGTAVRRDRPRCLLAMAENRALSGCALRRSRGDRAKRHQSSSPMRSRPSTPSQRIRS